MVQRQFNRERTEKKQRLNNERTPIEARLKPDRSPIEQLKRLYLRWYKYGELKIIARVEWRNNNFINFAHDKL